MRYPDDVQYHPTDTWARAEGGRVRVGITDFAQNQLGDIVYVDLPPPGRQLVAGQPFGEIESAKTVADLHAPVSGTVVEANSELGEQPELVNSDPYGAGWIVIVEGHSSSEQLLDAEGYKQNVERR